MTTAVLGIGGSVHDFSACIVRDGEVVAAVEEERLTRVKHQPFRAFGGDYRLRCVEYCLDVAGLDVTDLDGVYANDLLFPGVRHRWPQCRLLPHHLTHAAAAFLTSPFADATVMVADGMGSRDGDEAETVTHFAATREHIAPLAAWRGRLAGRRGDRPVGWSNFDHVRDSIGAFYEFVNGRLGFAAHDEGKLMGLAAYGDDRYVASMEKFVHCEPSGAISFSSEARTNLAAFIAQEWDDRDGDAAAFAVRAALAHAAQVALEEVLLRHVALAAEHGFSANLCLGGGVFMNCVANGRIAEESGFDALHVYGAAGDNGTAIGAAMLGYQELTGAPIPTGRRARGMFSGRAYSDTEMVAALRRHAEAVDWETLDDVVPTTAGLLDAGHIVAWFQGDAEFGARALGHRSILADPRRAQMREVINRQVKGREWFRPFAPAVLAEAQDEFFDLPADSSFMTVNGRVRPERAGDLGAVTHVDGTARVQTVHRDDNPLYYDLIAEFGRRTGVPVVLNTSFNEQEPIVETPDEALDCFLRTRMTYLVLGHQVVSRRTSH